MEQMLTTTARLRQLRISPRKVRLLIDFIRGMRVEEALAQLQFSKKTAARPVYKLLQSAVANARHNHQMKEDTLVIAQAFVDGGPTLYRWMPKAMGRATPIRKRTSHVTIVLQGEAAPKKEKKKDMGAESAPAEGEKEVVPAPKPKKAAAKKKTSKAKKI